MRVPCDVSYVDLENEEGRDVEGVRVTCSRCDHSTESFGTSESSTRRCLVLLREECPKHENNFYVEQ